MFDDLDETISTFKVAVLGNEDMVLYQNTILYLMEILTNG